MAPPRKRSRTRSGASPPESPHKQKIFLIDESMGRKSAAEALQAAGFRTLHVLDVFPAGTADEVWLAKAGAEQWIVVSRDRKIRKRPNEVAAIVDNRVFAFIVAAHGATGTAVAEQLRRYADTMARLATAEAAPAIYTIMRSGPPKRYTFR